MNPTLRLEMELRVTPVTSNPTAGLKEDDSGQIDFKRDFAYEAGVAAMQGPFQLDDTNTFKVVKFDYLNPDRFHTIIVWLDDTFVVNDVAISKRRINVFSMPPELEILSHSGVAAPVPSLIPGETLDLSVGYGKLFSAQMTPLMYVGPLVISSTDLGRTEGSIVVTLGKASTTDTIEALEFWVMLAEHERDKRDTLTSEAELA